MSESTEIYKVQGEVALLNFENVHAHLHAEEYISISIRKGVRAVRVADIELIWKID
jgi:hypothetical protein